MRWSAIHWQEARVRIWRLSNPRGGFAVDQAPEPLFEAEIVDLWHRQLLFEGVGHAVELQRLELVECRVFQHGATSVGSVPP